MRVLLVCSDLYKNIGGGQTVYQRIISNTLDVDFSYFSQSESENQPRPGNAHAIPLSPAREVIEIAQPVLSSPKLKLDLADGCRYARSVAGQEFDIVEYPDFLTVGSMLRAAFRRYNVRARRFVLAMHGNISTSIRLGWNAGGTASVLDIREAERKQFAEADAVYAISRQYMEEWQARTPRNIHFIEPLNFIDIPETAMTVPPVSDDPPSLFCAGRLERRKGNDIFVEMTRWLDRDVFASAYHVGDNESAGSSPFARDILYSVSTHRNLDFSHLEALPQKELYDEFRKRNLLIIPTRYDTLNLIVLEALLNGCPTAVSNRAGVCRYLDDAFPQLPYIKLDFDNLYSSIPAINDVLRRYDAYRGELITAVNDLLPGLRQDLRMGEYYRDICASPAECATPPLLDDIKLRKTRRTLASLGEAGFEQIFRRRAAGGAKRIARAIPGAYARSKQHAVSAAKTIPLLRRGVNKARMLRKTLRMSGSIRQLNWMPENSPDNVREKLNALYRMCGGLPVWRCTFWREIARLEAMRGNPLYAAVYTLRIARLVGGLTAGEIAGTRKNLVDAGMTREAEALDVLYGGGNEDMVYDFLRQAQDANRTKPDLPWETVKDWRSSDAPVVSVIVSLYKAAAKMKFFLTALQRQTLYQQDRVEIILVDSGSPEDEFAALLAAKREGVSLNNILYARSAQRETIQCAWNRGIKLARAPFLAFLGVDEGLYPDALERLAAVLENDPGVDWCMASSILTEVDARGLHERDVMVYDRRNADKDLTYLETCYLSYVGGLYRKDIHERFGYYDETFRGAGDTEFKQRVLPYINVRFIPESLGIFFNYPEARVTQSPNIEMEDLRAWYIHKTPGGVRYAFENRPDAEAEALLRRALGYRKSYCGHISSDIEHAWCLAEYLAGRQSSGLAEALLPDLRFMRERLRRYNQLVEIKDVSLVDSIFSDFAAIEARHRALLTEQDAQPAYQVLNDNQFEQHSWLWVPEERRQ